jgi:hypothetical protein
MNSLGGDRWEVVSMPQGFGQMHGTFDVEVRVPYGNYWEFPGGEQRFYMGKSDMNPEGVVFSFKRSSP